MPYLPGKIPFRGWITDSPYSAVPDGYTSDLLNIMPADPFRRRVRLGTRPASSRAYAFSAGQNVQCMVRTIAFNNSTTPPTRRDRVIIVAGGKFYYLDPGTAAPVQITQVKGVAGVTTAVMSSTVARIEGIQRGRYAYFVDGSGPSAGYVKVDLLDASLAITDWNAASGPEDHVKDSTSTYTASLISAFGARLVLGGVKTLENIWYMSNVADPDDWQPGTSTATSDAQAGTSGTLGYIGDEIVAMCPLGTSGFLMAGKRSLAYLTADPVFDTGARIATMSKTIGAVGPRAVCEGPEKSVYLLGQDGLYRIRPNDFDVDRGQLVSLNKLDSFFSGLRYEYLNPVLHYDVERRGVWIFLTRTDSPSNSTHLFYSEQVDGFFPIRLYDPSFYGASTVCQSGTADGRNQIMLCAYKNTISFFDQRLSSGCDGFPGSGFTAVSGPSTLSEKTAQLVQNRLSIGPIQPPQPVLVLAKELQVELAADDYLIPSSLKSGGTSIAERPKAVFLAAETPQEAIGENLNSLTVEDKLTVAYDGGNQAVIGTFDTTIDGGVASTSSWSPYADGGYSRTVAGIYTAQDALQSPLNRQYYTDDGIFLIQRQAFLSVNAGSFVIGNWYTITTVGTTSWTSIGAASNTVGVSFQATGVGSGTGVAKEIAWVIKLAADAAVNQNTNAEVVVFKQKNNNPMSDDVELDDYEYVVYNAGTPVVQSDQTVDVKISTFAAAESTDMGYLREGINNRMRCRIRSGAMYVRIGSTGWPWAIERVAIAADPISQRRAVIDVGATDESDHK